MMIKALFIILFINMATSYPYLEEETEKCGRMNVEGFYDWNKPLHWCGHYLAMGLKQICKGHYYYVNSLENIESNHRFQKSRTKRGIVEECCLNCCTALELKVYCSDRRPDYRKLFIPSADNDNQIYEIYK